MGAPKFEFKSVLTRNLLDPARHKGSPFTFVHCRDTKEVFFTDAEGNYINFGSILAAVMNGSLPLALPASPVAGPQGPRGERGEPGATVVGPAGPQGIPGPQGSLLIPTDTEIGVALKELRLHNAKIHAAFLEGMLKAESLKNTTVGVHLKLILEQIKRDAGITAPTVEVTVPVAATQSAPQQDEAALADAMMTARRSPDPLLRKRAAQRLETL